jgi:hypothetical protein
MVQNGLNPALELDEIREYEECLAVSLQDDIDVIMQKAPRGIREEINARVQNEMAKASIEMRKDPKYDILRYDTQLAYLDSLMADVVNAQDRRIALKDKTSIIQRLAKEQKDTIKAKNELLKELGVNLKELGKSTEIKDDRVGGEEVKKYGKVNLSSLRGDN